MQFPGFTPEDFDLFSIPDFAGRMTEIRARLKPKLIALAKDLAPQVEATLEGPVFPHVAQHMRRRVNPPVETWLAFARDKKGYKRWTHYRVAVSESGVRVTVFVEDDADDKPQLGLNLAGSPQELLATLGTAPVQWYTLGEAGTAQADLTPERLREAGSALQRLKTAKFQAGVPLPRAETLAMTPERFEAWAMEQMTLLKPLYLAGAQAHPAD
jgi:uncharacterized protein YktB (UPF0637 family)